MAKSWYLITTYVCPPCGHERTYRTRMTTPRPTEWADRHEIIEEYNYCD